MISADVDIKPAGNKGRGMFAKKDIAANTVLEISPIIELNIKDRKIIEETILGHYIFEWGNSHRKGAMALGYVAMYNHSYDANCVYEMEFEEQRMTVKTCKPVKKGEQLFINYNAVPDDKKPVWFDAE